MTARRIVAAAVAAFASVVALASPAGALTATVAPSPLSPGETVTLTVTPDAGCDFALNASGQVIAGVTDPAGNVVDTQVLLTGSQTATSLTYSFTVPLDGAVGIWGIGLVTQGMDDPGTRPRPECALAEARESFQVAPATGVPLVAPVAALVTGAGGLGVWLARRRRAGGMEVAT